MYASKTELQHNVPCAPTPGLPFSYNTRFDTQTDKKHSDAEGLMFVDQSCHPWSLLYTTVSVHIGKGWAKGLLLVYVVSHMCRCHYATE